MADSEDDPDFEEEEFEEEEGELSLETRVAGLTFRVIELEHRVEALLRVVKPYEQRWWREWSWRDFSWPAIFLSLIVGAQLAVILRPTLALPMLVAMTLAGLIVLVWFLYAIAAGLLSNDPERRREGFGSIALLVLLSGLMGLFPTETASWRMSLWLAVPITCVGAIGIFFFRDRR